MCNGALSMGTGLSWSWANAGSASAQASTNNEMTCLMEFLPSLFLQIKSGRDWLLPRPAFVVRYRIVRLPFAARNSDPESISAYFPKGEKPADLLLIRSAAFDLVIHLTTQSRTALRSYTAGAPADEAIRTPLFPAGRNG